MALIKYLNEHGASKVISEIKKRTSTVYNIKGKSYRGRKLKTVALEAGDTEQQPRPEE